MELTGFHHLTAITAKAAANVRFYTQTVGMRLVKKTVNQDDVRAYHLFYADALGSPGTDITFFDWPATPERRGTNSIIRTGLRVCSETSLSYWDTRLRQLGVKSSAVTDRHGRPTIDFEDFEGQRLSIVVDSKGGTGAPWNGSPVPPEHQIAGLGPITLSVQDASLIEPMLIDLMNMHEAATYTTTSSDGSSKESIVRVFRMDGAGAESELHVAEEPWLPDAQQGAGAVHHVAFRVPTFKEYDQWNERIKRFRVANSGPVDRFYFRSLYFREPNGILFELATDEPGFAADEPLEHLGERLALPPFLEPRRAEIEMGLKPID